MPLPLLAISAAIGIATSVAGIIQGNSAQDKLEAANRAFTAKQNELVDRQIKIQEKQARLSKKVEAQRFQQMVLDAQRQDREIIRQTIVSRAIALSNATLAGAGGGSGLAGGLAQAQAEGTSQRLGVGQNLEIGTNIFGLNAKLTDVGTRLNRVAGRLNQAQATFQGQEAVAQGEATQAQGLFNLGQSIISNSSTFASVGTSLLG